MRGKITEIKQNERNFFFRVERDSRSFSGFGQCEFVVGDFVEFELKVNGKYNNAQDIKLFEPSVHEETTEAPKVKADPLSDEFSQMIDAACVISCKVVLRCAEIMTNREVDVKYPADFRQMVLTAAIAANGMIQKEARL